MLAAASLADARAGDKTADLSQVRVALALFQDQKAEFLAQQKEAKNYAKKVRAEIREQMKTTQSGTLAPMRQEARKSVEEAKRQAVEQSRKVASEGAEVARDVRR